MKSPTTEARTIARPVPSPNPAPIPMPGGSGGIQPAAADPATITGTMPAHTQAGMPLEIDGTNFENVQHVFIGGIDSPFSVMSSTVIKTTVPSQLGPGTALIQVQTILDNGSIATSVPYSKFVVDPATFDFTGFTPDSGRPGDTVTLFGTGFSRLKTVTFNRAAPLAVPPVVIVSETQATVVVPADAQTGVITCSDGPDNKQKGPFTVLAPLVVFLDFNPKKGIVGDPITITGKHFGSVTGVVFNKVPVQPGDEQLGASQQIIAKVPQGATTGPITLKSPVNSPSSATDFVVIQKPVLDSVTLTPPAGRAGAKVVLTGKHLAETDTIDFNGILQPNFVEKSEKKIRTTVPNGLSAGLITITVKNRAGQAQITYMMT
ncbi:MAG TPA: IPT/TIG domain-containing protein [Candidatus Elarobacter sp.]|nr:IPT/TIG domain-containing protein [Candidatus Elarobacter sp.]